MKKSLLLPLLAIAGGICLSHSAQAVTPIFQIGIKDGNQAEFEQEGGGRNDAQYYVNNGDYTSLTGLSGNGVNWTSGMEPFKDDINNNLGFPRALVLKDWVIGTDLFFQIGADVALSPYIRFDTTLILSGANTSHTVEFKLNGTTFYSSPTITLTTEQPDHPVVIDIPSANFNVGSNVISMQRTGGVGDSPWIQFDYINLSAVPEPSLGMLALMALGFGAARRRREHLAE